MRETCRHCQGELKDWAVSIIGPCYNAVTHEVKQNKPLQFCNWNCCFMFQIDSIVVSEKNSIVEETWIPILKQLHDHILSKL